MKRRALIGIATLAALVYDYAIAHAEPLDDKDKHFIAGAVIGSTLDIGATLAVPEVEPWKRHAIAGGVCLAAAAGKELVDAEAGGKADPWDAAATAGGCAMGLVIGGGFSAAMGRDEAAIRYTVRF